MSISPSFSSLHVTAHCATTREVVSPTCPACRSTGWSASGFLANDRFPLVHCEGCGLGALSIAESDEDGFDEYWSEVNQRIYADPAVVDELATKYEKYYRRLQTEVPNKRFLDVGSGAGVSVGTAASLGFQAIGIEPSASAVALSRQRYDVPITHGLLSADDSLPRDFGLLALWDVIEHVEDPESLVRACYVHLSPGGVMILETPDEGALLRRLIVALGRVAIRPLDLRRSIYYRAHRYYFTRAAMTHLLERCGLTQVRYVAEHTMFQKELRKKALYDAMPVWRQRVLRVMFALLRATPLLANKMVVIATKAA